MVETKRIQPSTEPNLRSNTDDKFIVWVDFMHSKVSEHVVDRLADS